MLRRKSKDYSSFCRNFTFTVHKSGIYLYQVWLNLIDYDSI